MDRIEKAKELFKSGYNCSQAVVGAYSDLFGMDPETAMSFAEGFGGGMGRMRLTCGAVSAMFMLVGLKYSKAVAGDTNTRTLIYETVRKMAAEFEKSNGSIVCGDLLGINSPKDTSAKPEERTENYYKKRPCVECVGDCAKLVEKYLHPEQATAQKRLPANVYEIADLTVDCDKFLVKRGGKEITLSVKEFSVLEYMIKNKGIVLSRERIENNIWDLGSELGSNVVDVYISYLRKKIDEEHDVKLIHTVRGRGYVLRDENEQ